MKKGMRLCLLLCVGILVCSCQTASKKLVAYEVGGATDAADGGVHQTEYSLWENALKPYEDPTAAATYLFAFSDEIFELSYAYSMMEYGELYQKDYYESDVAKVGIRHDTGEVVWYVSQKNVSGLTCHPELYTLAYCQSAAEAFLRNYVNLDEYQQENVSEEETFCDFRYRKHIGGIPTVEWFHVMISRRDGCVEWYRFVMLQEYQEEAIRPYQSDLDTIRTGAEAAIFEKACRI